MSKKVIMLLIDSLMYPSLQKAVNEGKASALQFFMDHGKLYQDVVSPFPTMSVNVDSSLLTGTYADKHQIPGLVWYNETERRLINYGSHIRELVKLGLMKSLQDIFFHLNNEHLSKEVKTIHEELADQGLTTASINTLIYRGKFDQMLKCPFLILFPLLKTRTLQRVRSNLHMVPFLNKVLGKSIAIFGIGMVLMIRFLPKNSFILLNQICFRTFPLFTFLIWTKPFISMDH